MNRSGKILSLIVVASTLLFAGCKKEEILTFGGQMDKLTVDDENGSKVYLGHAEQWLYWETGDDIAVYAEESTTPVPCDLISGSATLNAYFKSRSPISDAAYYHAIYPASSGGSGYTDLIFPAEQPYRESTSPTHPDSSFGRGAMPMVAYNTDFEDNMTYFHVVAGILRLQFYSSEEKTISSITFKETAGKQISGHFTVHDINENMPYLTATDASTPNNKITITGVNKSIGPNSLLTFYLPLPAVVNASNYEQYNLEMTIQTTDGKYFRRSVRADIHRRNITMMPALKITGWADADVDGSLGGMNIELVGSGTKDRPFQIYTAQELGLVRLAFSAGGTVTVNGQRVKGVPNSGNTDLATHFKIVRSDIVLNDDNWEEGIQDFYGYMYFASSTATNGGIANNSTHPLFESISDSGVVHRVYVKGSSSPTVASAFSPMCHTNRGRMIECHNKCAVTIVDNHDLAGLCVDNYGDIIGGANEAALVTEGSVAGICVNNRASGFIQGNFTLSSAVPQGENVAGIVINNYGQVQDCQVSANTNVNSSGNWGVIAFDNKTTGRIDNCISTGAVLFTINGSLGGICNINSGTVCNCSNNVELRASSGNVGGIVATMDNASAKVYNCCTEGFHYVIGAVNSVAADYCGGIVGWLNSGSVRNCYNSCPVEGAVSTGGVIGFVGATAVVENSWDGYGHQFAGSRDGSATLGEFCFSAAAADDGCNLFSKTTYIIGTMLAGQDAATTYVGQHLSAPLNDWVDGHDTIYYRWTTNAGLRPRFDTTPSKSGKKGRAQVGKRRY